MQTYPCTVGLPPSALPEAPSKYSMDNFSPVGLHVLVVDDDPLCLLVLERMLKSCSYKVTTCNCANRALDILRDSEDEVDLVLSDVYMPDVDGFKLLEIIGLELDLPVIMMSANGDTDVVMKGITHGACNYLVKPIRIEELTVLWQHVVRQKGTESYSLGLSTATGSTSSGEVPEVSSKKRKEVSDMDQGLVEDASILKKGRVNWTVDLHQRFVSAVNELGVEKAVPKKLLQVMNVKGLTRENVASHLQKYRLFLKRLSGVMPERSPRASFQASGDGKSGGTMRILPGGRISKTLPTIKELSLGAGITGPKVGMQKLAAGSSQQQQQRSANRAQVLDALGLWDSRQGDPPQGNSSFDLRPFLQVPQNPLFSCHSMPSSLSTLSHSCSQSWEQGLDDEGARSKSVQLEGFVNDWNINPKGEHETRVYTPSTDAKIEAYLSGSPANLLSGDLRHECSEDIQYLEIPDNINVSDRFLSCELTTDIDREANLDALDVLQFPEQLSPSDYLMSEDLPFDDHGFGFLSL